MNQLMSYKYMIIKESNLKQKSIEPEWNLECERLKT